MRYLCLFDAGTQTWNFLYDSQTSQIWMFSAYLWIIDQLISDLRSGDTAAKCCRIAKAAKGYFSSDNVSPFRYLALSWCLRILRYSESTWVLSLLNNYKILEWKREKNGENGARVNVYKNPIFLVCSWFREMDMTAKDIDFIITSPETWMMDKQRREHFDFTLSESELPEIF